MRKRRKKNFSRILSSENSGKAYISYDIVGNIAIIRLSQDSPKNVRNAAKAIMEIHKNVKTVLVQASPVVGDFRLRRLAHVAGENKTSIIHKEYGCLFSVDLAKCYFSPRLSHERMRIAGIVKPNETVVNMFAGVGCFSIIIAKHANVAKVFSIDANPTAVQFMQENIRLNRVYDKVIPLLGDSKAIVTSLLQHIADRVLMPLPEKAFEYLPFAVSALKASGGWIHYYAFEHADKTENPTEKTKLEVAEKLDNLDYAFKLHSSRVIRSTGPNWYQVALDIHVTRVPDKS